MEKWGAKKLVFLDSDMLIVENIDFLFEYPGFSACSAGHFLNSSWIRLNSGIMVIEPDDKVFRGLMKQLPLTLRRYSMEGKNVGDQDVINDFMSDWPERKQLHLPEGLNMFFKYLTFAKSLGFSFKNTNADKRIYVVHFVGAIKPWHLNGTRRLLYLLKVVFKNHYGLGVFRRYMNLIK